MTCSLTFLQVQFTVPAAADNGQNILPTIKNPNATDPQSVCKGYTAQAIERTVSGFTATLMLAGDAVSTLLAKCEWTRLTANVVQCLRR